MAYKERVCTQCGVTFTPHQHNQRRCSKCIQETDTRGRYSKEQRYQVCKGCGETFTRETPAQFFCTPECKRDNYYLIKSYGITRAVYKALLVEQNDKCGICGSEGFKINKNARDKLVVDHDHNTGDVRGLICHNCNRGLGLFQDSTDNLSNAIEYLQKRPTTIPNGSTPKQVEAWSKGLKGS